MIVLLDLDNFSKGLTPVTSPNIFTTAGQLEPTGIFSEEIFGPVGSSQRKTTYSYISLLCKVLHPTFWKIFSTLDRRILSIISTEKSYVVQPNGSLKEDPSGWTGITNLIRYLPKIDLRPWSERRAKLIEQVRKYYDRGTLFIDKIPVLPPAYREIYKDKDGRWMYDQINDYYLKILRLSKQISNVPKTNEMLYNIMSYRMQSFVVDLNDFMLARIGKKRGILRSRIMGKRVDFSARAVIAPGPNLRPDQVGLPLRVAVKVFEPFVLHQLLYKEVNQTLLAEEVRKQIGKEVSVDTLKKVLDQVEHGDEIRPKLLAIIRNATERAMHNRVVLMKRDPVLQVGSIKAMYPILTDDKNVIRLSGPACKSFNADFDGDQMAVFHPLSDEAQKQAKEKMIRSTFADTHKSVAVDISKDMILGCYTATKEYKSTRPPISIKNLEELDPDLPVNVPVKFGKILTTSGRVYFNLQIPKKYRFINEPVTVKIIKELLSKLADDFDDETVFNITNRVAQFGYKYSTLIPASMPINELYVSAEVKKLRNQLKGKDPETATELMEKMDKLVQEEAKKKGLQISDLVESGASKGMKQVRQVVICKGIAQDAEGNILPVIDKPLVEGLNSNEYFDASYGARQGVVSRALNTAPVGYLSRQLAYVLNDVQLHPTLRDCKTKRKLELKITSDLVDKLSGRYLGPGRKLQTPKRGSVIKIRSPIFCKSPKICHTCYGDLMYRSKTLYCGILAAQIFGEALQQSMLSSFHMGGAVDIQKVDLISEIAKNELYLNKKQIKSLIRQDGRSIVSKQKGILVFNPSNFNEEGDDYRITESSIWMKNGIFDLEFRGSIKLTVIVDYACEVPIEGLDVRKKEGLYIVPITVDQVIFEFGETMVGISHAASYVTRLLSGKEPFKNPRHLLMKFFDLYNDMKAIELVHYEVVLSNVLRAKQDPSLPARVLEPYDPVTMNIKEVVFRTSFLQGFAFENVNKAIQTGLVQERKRELTPLEQILVGELS